MQAVGEEVTIAIGKTLPPYVINETDSGMETDIIRGAFHAKGYKTVNIINLADQMLPICFKNRNVDGVSAKASYDIGRHTGIKAFSSDVTIHYRTYTVALAKVNFKIKSIDDVVFNKEICFKNVADYPGPAFAAIAIKNQSSEEHLNQNMQAKMYYPILSSTSRNCTFHNKQIRDDFNTGLKMIHDNGIYGNILAKYGNKYGWQNSDGRVFLTGSASCLRY